MVDDLLTDEVTPSDDTTTTESLTTDAVLPTNYEPETVENRMEGLLSSSSPYIKRARASSQKQANSRGLLNSSIAAGAGEAAAIEAALPIAQQDADTISRSRLQAQSAGETKDIMDTGLQNDITLEGAKTDFQKDLYQTQFDFESQLSAMEFSSEETKAIGSSVTLLGQTLSDKVAQIQVDTELTADAKTTIIEQLTAMYQSQLDSVAAVYGVPIEWA